MGSILPRKIAKSPLIASTAELRFSGAVTGPALFALLYSAEQERYPTVEQLPALNIPPQMANFDPNLAFQPHYKATTSDGRMSYQVGPRVFSFSVEPRIEIEDIRGELARLLKVLIQAKGLAKVERVGLRYINLFEGMNLLSRSTLGITLNGKDITSNPTNFRSEFTSGAFTTALSLMSHAQVATGIVQPSIIPPTNARKGSLLDFDVSVQNPAIDGDESTALLGMFIEAHDLAKKLFFEVLRDDLIEELGPEL